MKKQQQQAKPTQMKAAPVGQKDLKKVAGGISEQQCKAAGGTWDRGTKVCHL